MWNNGIQSSILRVVTVMLLLLNKTMQQTNIQDYANETISLFRGL